MLLEKRTLEIEHALRHALAVIDNRSEADVALFLSHQDKMRLLNLHVWSLRYKLPLEQLLNILLNEHFVHHRRRHNRALGIRVNTLTGKKVEQFIRSYTETNFAQYELEEAHKVELIRRCLQQQPIEVTYTDLNMYKETLEKQRRRSSFSRSKFRRAWRNNPWR